MDIRKRWTQLLGTFRNAREFDDASATIQHPATEVTERPVTELEASDPFEEDFEPPLEDEDQVTQEEGERLEAFAFPFAPEPRRPTPEEIQTCAYYK